MTALEILINIAEQYGYAVYADHYQGNAHVQVVRYTEGNDEPEVVKSITGESVEKCAALLLSEAKKKLQLDFDEQQISEITLWANTVSPKDLEIPVSHTRHIVHAIGIMLQKQNVMFNEERPDYVPLF